MARKPAPSKTTPSPEKPSISGKKPPRGKSASQQTSKSTNQQTSKSTNQPTNKPTPKPRAPRTPRAKPDPSHLTPPPPLVPALSLDRKLDIAGVIMALLGLVIGLLLFSANRSAISEGLIFGLSQVFGWGAYLLPLALLAGGLWLILRNFEKIPSLDPERLTGLTLLLFNVLTLLHFILFTPDKATSYELAKLGQGGGYLGAFLSETLIAWIGQWGTLVAILAWFLTGLMLTFDLAAADFFRWVDPLSAALGRILARGRAALGKQFLEALQQVSKSASQPISQSADQPTSQPTHPNPEAPTPLLPLSASPFPLISSSPSPKWVLPAIPDILDVGIDTEGDDDADKQRALLLEETLASFGAPAHVVEINRGPTFTQYGVEPDFLETRNGRIRVRVGKIAALADDLALALAAERIRIQAPVPGKGYVGIEVPNGEIAVVALRDVVESESFTKKPAPLRLAMGQNVSGQPISANLANMPHLLIAGATGSGKSVCVNAIIACLLLHNTPDDLRLIMIDPKRVELTGYNGIPHLLAPVVVEMERVIGALQWVTREMDTRYQKFHDTKCRNLADYNGKMAASGGKKLPMLVVIIDELADLMMLAPDQTEKTITRLAQLARATGIHLIIATQRPSVDVVTGLIKANLPARVAFAVSSMVDSRVILDQPGAERLLGRGDMLFQAPDAPAPARLQGVYVSDAEITRLVQFWRFQAAEAGVSVRETTDDGTPQPTTYTLPADAPAPGIPLKQVPMFEMETQEERDPMWDEALDLIRRQGRASVSMLQRRLRIGYTRAARIVEIMEDKGIVGPPEGATQVRQVLDYGPAGPPADHEN
ncbi:MAG: DNA translocase FtsK 4TM domain-containing protein [Anaerolineales bacterium]|nr:DNA translocase FtsK 4TM domain-containing protein [Anaerolineales bacterium]